jgi:hypothetical protein
MQDKTFFSHDFSTPNKPNRFMLGCVSNWFTSRVASMYLVLGPAGSVILV